MNPSLRKFLMWGGALIVVIIAVSLIAGRTKVEIPVSTS